jgi:hypothetical protein
MAVCYGICSILVSGVRAVDLYMQWMNMNTDKMFKIAKYTFGMYMYYSIVQSTLSTCLINELYSVSEFMG